MSVINLEFRNKGVNTTIASLGKVSQILKETADNSQKVASATSEAAKATKEFDRTSQTNIEARNQLYASTEDILNRTRENLDSLRFSRGLGEVLDDSFGYRDGEFSLEKAEAQLYDLRTALGDLQSAEPLNVLDAEY